MYRDNDDGAYAVLGFQLDDKTGAVTAAVTLRGVFPVQDMPVWTPEGAVVRGENVWPSPHEYFKWAEKRVI